MHGVARTVDAILKCVYDHAKSRPIFFSSFNPDVCTLLAQKQANYPVAFLTDSGWEKMYDLRCNSLKDGAHRAKYVAAAVRSTHRRLVVSLALLVGAPAIQFATSSGLVGIVSNVAPLLRAPRLIRTVKQAGLLLLTYGGENNEPDSVRLQRQWGVDTIIAGTRHNDRLVEGLSSQLTQTEHLAKAIHHCADHITYVKDAARTATVV